MAHLASRKLTQKASACSAAIALPQRACPARAVKLSATPELAEESASSRRALLMGLAVAGVLPQLVNVSAAQAEGGASRDWALGALTLLWRNHQAPMSSAFGVYAAEQRYHP